MKTKWLVGIVGIALLLGMMVSCNTGDGSAGQPFPTITLKANSFVNINTATAQKGTDSKITLSVGVPVTVSEGTYSIEVTFKDDDTKLVRTSPLIVGSTGNNDVTVEKKSGAYSFK
jgi:hypothetical protein